MEHCKKGPCEWPGDCGCECKPCEAAWEADKRQREDFADPERDTQ